MVYQEAWLFYNTQYRPSLETLLKGDAQDRRMGKEVWGVYKGSKSWPALSRGNHPKQNKL